MEEDLIEKICYINGHKFTHYLKEFENSLMIKKINNVYIYFHVMIGNKKPYIVGIDSTRKGFIEIEDAFKYLNKIIRKEKIKMIISS